jgi:prepilin-type N-terminal cleavage/methylation domain-containing protein
VISPCVRTADERGFTLVEVMVAILVLLVGVLGVVAMVEGANAVTSKTKAREGGTNVARSIIEISRSIRYRDLTATELLDELSSRPGLSDVKPGETGHTVLSRDVEYEVTLTVCSLDDPQDGHGPHTGPITYCSDSALPEPGQDNDKNPDDYKRVRVTLNWSTRGVGHSITQTSAIINPVGGLGPSVTSVTPMNVANDDPILLTADEQDHIDFHVTTSSPAEGVKWSVGGELRGEATGDLTNWDFTWELDDASGATVYHDCTYVIEADAFDSQDRSGTPRSRTVIVNRHEPNAPTGPTPGGLVGAGRNGAAGGFVDIQWVQNPECDIRGYRVYRSDTEDVLGSPITCIGETTDITEDIECLDVAAEGQWWFYTVVALDLPPDSSVPREGAASEQVAVGDASDRPPAPEDVALCIGDGTTGCLDAGGVPAPVGMVVVSWSPSTDPDGIQFYRIYRDGVTFADRYDDYFPSATDPGFAWFEFDSTGGPHTYRVSAVDGAFAESELSAEVTDG